jgi:purine-binding chemotaxis protein CheW
MSPSGDAQSATQYLSFFVGEEEYGLGILESREIIQYPSVTRVPSMPAAIRGVINLRGSVVPVIDLAVLFGVPELPLTKWTCVVVVEAQQHRGQGTLVGLVVDSVSQVIDLGPEDIEPPPAFGTQIKRRLLRGMAKTDKKFVLLLDLEHLLADIDLDEVSAPTPAEDLSPAPDDGHEAADEFSSEPRAHAEAAPDTEDPADPEEDPDLREEPTVS